MKRVLLVNKLYFPDVGGVETAVRQYAELYKELGYDVTVLCCHNKFHRKTTIDCIDGVKVIKASTLGYYLSMPVSIAFLSVYFKVINQFDIVHVNMPYPQGTLATLLFKQRIKGTLVASYHCDLFRHKWLKKLSYYLDKRLLAHADKIITNSPVLRDKSPVLATINKQIDIIPYYVDLGKVQYYLSMPSSIELPSHFIKEGYFIFFGRLVGYKGIAFLIEALQLLFAQGKFVNTVIAGEGPDAELVRQFAAQNQRHVYYIDSFLTEADKFHLLKGARAFLFPSQNVAESFGIAQLEAMSVGCPIINCDIGTGVNWVAPNQNCAVTTPLNAQIYSVALHEIFNINKADRWNFLSKNAVFRVNTLFCKNKIIRNLF